MLYDYHATLQDVMNEKSAYLERYVDHAYYNDILVEDQVHAQSPRLLFVERTSMSKGTLGRCYAYVDGVMTPLATTVELPMLNNQRFKSAIPCGFYVISAETMDSSGCKRLYVNNVPDRTGIFLHAASSPNQLEGCIGINKPLASFLKADDPAEVLMDFVIDADIAGLVVFNSPSLQLSLSGSETLQRMPAASNGTDGDMLKEVTLLVGGVPTMSNSFGVPLKSAAKLVLSPAYVAVELSVLTDRSLVRANSDSNNISYFESMVWEMDSLSTLLLMLYNPFHLLEKWDFTSAMAMRALTDCYIKMEDADPTKRAYTFVNTLLSQSVREIPSLAGQAAVSLSGMETADADRIKSYLPKGFVIDSSRLLLTNMQANGNNIPFLQAYERRLDGGIHPMLFNTNRYIVGALKVNSGDDDAEDAYLQVPSGLAVVYGPSGGGKTSFIRYLMEFMKGSEGVPKSLIVLDENKIDTITSRVGRIFASNSEVFDILPNILPGHRRGIVGIDSITTMLYGSFGKGSGTLQKGGVNWAQKALLNILSEIAVIYETLIVVSLNIPGSDEQQITSFIEQVADLSVSKMAYTDRYYRIHYRNGTSRGTVNMSDDVINQALASEKQPPFRSSKQLASLIGVQQERNGDVRVHAPDQIENQYLDQVRAGYKDIADLFQTGRVLEMTESFRSQDSLTANNGYSKDIK